MKHTLKIVFAAWLVSSSAFAVAIKLKNGATLDIEQDSSTPRQSLSLIFEGGNGLIRADEQGSGSILSSILEQGPEGMTQTEYKRQLFLLGAQVNFGYAPRRVMLSVTAKPEKLGDALALALNTLQKPKLTAEAYTQARSEVEAGVAAREDNMSQSLSYFARRDAFVYHPDVLDGSASKRSLKNVDLSKVKAALPVLFNPEHLLLASVGPADPKAIEDQINEKLGAAGLLSKPYKALAFKNPRINETPKTPWKVTVLHKKDATDNQVFYIVRRVLPLDNVDQLAMVAANTNFGVPGTGRLYKILREQRGLTYHAGSSASYNLGFWSVNSFASTDKVAALLKGIEEQVQLQASSKIDKDTLDKIKGQILSNWKEGRELAVDRLGNAIEARTFNRDPNFDVHLDKHLAKVTEADVDRLGKTFISLKDSRLYLMGDKDKLGAVLKGMGYQDKEIRFVETDSVL